MQVMYVVMLRQIEKAMFEEAQIGFESNFKTSYLLSLSKHPYFFERLRNFFYSFSFPIIFLTVIA